MNVLLPPGGVRAGGQPPPPTSAKHDAADFLRLCHHCPTSTLLARAHENAARAANVASAMGNGGGGEEPQQFDKELNLADRFLQLLLHVRFYQSLRTKELLCESCVHKEGAGPLMPLGLGRIERDICANLGEEWMFQE